MTETKPFSISRVFNAPRAVVWQVFTDPAHLSRWAGPPGTKMLKADMDLRVGGRYHYGTEAPDGARMWGKQVYREIVPIERLVYLQSFSDESGATARHPMAPSWPLEMLSTVTLEDLGDGRTRVTTEWLPFESDEAGVATFDGARGGMEHGFDGYYGHLDAHLDRQQSEILISRLVRAPRERVWQALTDPAQVNRWWGPSGFQNIDVEQDVRVGGEWRFKMVGPDGTVFPNCITYRELTPPSRMVYDHGDGESVHFQQTVTLDEEAGGTRVSLHLRFPSREARDNVLKFGVIEGGQQTLGKLDAFVGEA